MQKKYRQWTCHGFKDQPMAGPHHAASPGTSRPRPNIVFQGFNTNIIIIVPSLLCDRPTLSAPSHETQLCQYIQFEFFLTKPCPQKRTVTAQWTKKSKRTSKYKKTSKILNASFRPFKMVSCCTVHLFPGNNALQQHRVHSSTLTDWELPWTRQGNAMQIKHTQMHNNATEVMAKIST